MRLDTRGWYLGYKTPHTITGARTVAARVVTSKALTHSTTTSCIYRPTHTCKEVQWKVVEFKEDKLRCYWLPYSWSFLLFNDMFVHAEEEGGMRGMLRDSGVAVAMGVILGIQTLCREIQSSSR